MRATTRVIALFLAGALALGCGDDDPAPGGGSDGLSDTGGEPDAAGGEPDEGPDPGADPDVAPDGPEDVPDPSTADVPEATEELWAGAARVPLGFPIGIPTVGYGPTAGGPSTPFSNAYPGTLGEHTEVNAKALVLRREGKALVLMRLDAVGVWDGHIVDLANRLRELGRADLAEGLIVNATHTHSSGGRIFDHPVGEIAVDTFIPELYQRLRDRMAEAVLAADAAAVPARIGHKVIEVPELHSDRRCENELDKPSDIDDSMGLIKVEAVEDDHMIALGIWYSVHGTVLNRDSWVLSSDATGGIELGIEARLDAPTEVMFLQGWAGEMSPKSSDAPITAAGHERLHDFVKIDAMGKTAADIVIPELDDIEMSTTPEIDVVTVRFPLTGAVANPDGAFDDYPHGGIYCVSPEENCGPDAEPYTELLCLAGGFAEEESVDNAAISAARIGDLGFVTLPGEPLTSVGTELRDRAADRMGLPTVFVLGYAQGYLGYLLHPEDYWMGGYEGSGALMGPGGAQYLIDIGVGISGLVVDPDSDPGFEPIPVEPAASVQYPELTGEAPKDTPGVVSGPAGEEVVEMVFRGGDAAVDLPIVTLEVQQGDGSWATATRPNGVAVDSRGPEMELHYEADPPFSKPGPRNFLWTLTMPTVRSVPPAHGQLSGTYRFRVNGQTPDPYELTSDPFSL